MHAARKLEELEGLQVLAKVKTAQTKRLAILEKVQAAPLLV